ncbi:MAG: response regulator [Polyangiaceae bacterium]
MADERILVVDDKAANLKLVRVVLEREGYEVRTAADAEGALRELSSLKPRLILMDVQLPGIDGLELTRRVKSDPATKDIVVLALSASTTRGDEEKALAAGCDGYIAKPIDVGSLPRVIAGYLVSQPDTAPAA